MKPQDVSWLTDGPARWREALDQATDLERLMETLAEWREMCPDAWDARPMDEREFVLWRVGLKKERGPRKRFDGEEFAKRFGAVLIPARMLQVGMIAEQWHVPWGTALIRLEEHEAEQDHA